MKCVLEKNVKYVQYKNVKLNGKNKMLKKAQMPVKNSIVLMVIIFLVLSLIGTVTYFFVYPQFVDDPLEPFGPEEYSAEYLTSADYNASEFKTLDLSNDFEIDLKRNQSELDHFIKSNNLSSEEVYELLDLYNAYVIDELRTELKIDQGEAAYLWALISSQRRNYPEFDDETAYNLVGMDLLTYDQKIESEVELPEEVYSNFIPSSAQETLYVSLKTEQTLEDYIVEVQQQENSDDGSNIAGMAISNEKPGFTSDSSSLSAVEIIMEETYKHLETNKEQFSSSFCTLGVDKMIRFNLDDLILQNETVNFTFDQIVFGPEGNLLEELSVKDKLSIDIVYNESGLILNDFVNIPTNFEEGKYIIEYIFYDQNSFEKNILRVMLDCQERMFIDEFNLIKQEGEEYYVSENNLFQPGDLVLAEFYVDGFGVELNGEEEQFKVYFYLFDSLGNLVYSLEDVVKGGIEMEEEQVVYFVQALELPENLLSGDYNLILTVENLISNKFVDAFSKLEVEQ